MYVLPCNFKDFQKKLYVNSRVQISQTVIHSY